MSGAHEQTPAELYFRARVRLVSTAHPRCIALLAPMPERARAALLAQLLELGAQAWTAGVARHRQRQREKTSDSASAQAPALATPQPRKGSARPPASAGDSPMAAFAAALSARKRG